MPLLARSFALIATSVLGVALVPPPIIAQEPSPPRPTPSWVPATATGPDADSADVTSPEAIVAAFYDVISGRGGVKRDWNRLRPFFIPGARLVPSRPRQGGNGAEVLVLDLERWIERTAPIVERDGFYLKEIGASRRRSATSRTSSAPTTSAARRSRRHSCAGSTASSS